MQHGQPQARTLLPGEGRTQAETGAHVNSPAVCASASWSVFKHSVYRLDGAANSALLNP